MIEKRQSDKTSYAEGHDLISMRSMQKELEASRTDGKYRSFNEYTRSEQGLPAELTLLDEGVERRSFLKIMGASMSLAGLAACTKQPTEKIVPYVDAPEELIPGKPLFYATGFPFNGVIQPVLAESHMGRPTKIEGNDRHPGSQGGCTHFAQASVLDLYDLDRSKTVLKKRVVNSWSNFSAFMEGALAVAKGKQGAGVRLLLESHSSPTLKAQIEQFISDYPKAKVHFHDAAGTDSAKIAATAAFGKALQPVYQLSQAKVILSLDGDFLSAGTNGHLRYARDFADGRDLTNGNREMNRLYMLESNFSSTGTVADHRLAVTPSRLQAIARHIATHLGIEVSGEGFEASVAEKKWISTLVSDLKAAGSSALVISGDQQPPAMHVLAHAINEKLGAMGNTVQLIEQVSHTVDDSTASFTGLVEDMEAGSVNLLVILEANPGYTAPGDIDFEGALAKVENSVHVGSHIDETAVLTTWHVPMAHYLEAWSDGRSQDGFTSLLQPLIQPLNKDAKSAHEIMALLNGDASATGYDIVQAHWTKEVGESKFNTFWRTALHDGFIISSATRSVSAKVNTELLQEAPSVVEQGKLEVCIRPDFHAWDGRFVNNAWLQELPSPVLTLTWDNAIFVSPTTAEDLGLMTRGKIPERDTMFPESPILSVKVGNLVVSGPALIVPGHADGVLTLTLGYGRSNAGEVGGWAGYSAYGLRTRVEGWNNVVDDITKTNRTQKLALTQDHNYMEGRALAREGTLEQYKHDAVFAHKMGHEFPDSYNMYPQDAHNQAAHQWGMTIDLNRCVNCNACIVACQAENNIPSVGRVEVMRGREMHWLRVDRYFEGEPFGSNVRIVTQPVACLHCELAPCETVCPVGATMHSDEGLNQMVYNRCVGTRYCANNCPYKVRRFNYFQYTNLEENTLNLGQNPDVTVRTRGVMEKCTYCVQRINHARIDAKIQGRHISDGEVVTACEQACPTKAITFGNIKDPESRVSKLREEPLAYKLLGEVNTRPRTLHLARVRNTSLTLEPYVEQSGHGAGHGGDAHEAPHAETPAHDHDAHSGEQH